MPIETQKLIFSGHQLPNEQTLEASGVEHETSVMLVIIPEKKEMEMNPDSKEDQFSLLGTYSTSCPRSSQRGAHQQRRCKDC